MLNGRQTASSPPHNQRLQLFFREQAAAPASSLDVAGTTAIYYWQVPQQQQ